MLKTLVQLLWLPVAIMVIVGCNPSNTGREQSQSDLVPLEFLPALKGDYFKFDSDIIGRGFHIYVRLPEGYDGNGDKHYPIVYLLDGDSLFPMLAANHLFLTYDDGLPEAIVVGIAYGSFDPVTNKRGFDFSTHTADGGSNQGGAARFHEFLKSELIPKVEARYLVDSSKRILFGQSRGGHLVLYSAFTEPDLFWGRIASNPVFDPARERFFSQSADSQRDDLGLIVTSGSRDRAGLRKVALQWHDHWQDSSDAPWDVTTVTIEGGTHAADSANSYRLGLNWLFNRD